MKPFEFISRITIDDLEFYSVNVGAFISAFYVPWLQELKEVMGIIAIGSVIIYNYWKIKNERKRHKKDKSEDAG